ncbi:conserved oligomeric Golgi complex subunit 1-like isoform X2 [Dreissena polymorpha]|uniref:conserved oligomeric Golgi complex subunit 1-like isoform X2 n=1 Tax=Dreissena polymorpha TaxID=45954 RepID=UPI0022645012|nr:conserved oligomeric Golgi complex subunit 1-like isoform X2 [Dreissena polymorpha]
MTTDGRTLPVQEMDSNRLFEVHTIEEIRGIEKRTRSDIERKKEDLRTMVGERYRDLIEAADTIAEMKNSALNVMSTISNIEGLCKELKQSHMISGSAKHRKNKLELDNRRKEEARFHEVSSQIKLLLDMPEKIWTYLDNEDFLSASRLYLLSQHINTSLHLNSQNASNFLYWFPVLTRQWAAISHFKSTILQGCRQVIKESSVSDQKIAESLCSILLLENSNPRQVFNEFLLARTSAIQALFQAGTSSTKELVCSVVQLISTTIHQIYAVFYNNEGAEDKDLESANLLLKSLVKVTSEKLHESGLVDFQSSASSKSLPKSVTEFCPSHKSVSMGVSESHLHDNCKQWIHTCTTDIKTGVGKLLNYVKTVKHLAAIRDAVWDMMHQDSNQVTWEGVCLKVLNEPLYIWQDLIRPLFVDRVKTLIQQQFEATVDMTRKQIGKIITEVDSPQGSSLVSEADMGSYVWSESPGDLAPNTAWGTAGSRTLLESGGLMMKAKAYTPVIQSFCKSVDEKLKSIEVDYKFYIFSDVDTLCVTVETQPFNRYADSVSLLNYVQVSCLESVNSLMEYLTQLLGECRTALAAVTERQNTVGNKLLLTGRLCAALCDLTPHLRQNMLGRDQIASTDGSRSLLKKSVSARSPGQQEMNAVWEDVKSRFTELQQSVYRVWIDHVVATSLTGFTAAVHSNTTADLVQTCSKWEEVSIEEETEDGKKVSSKISVPMQASWYVMSLLYGLCRDLNNMGGHALARGVLEYLVYSVSDGMVSVYACLVNQSSSSKEPVLTQQRALQLLFDVKFLRLIIPRKDDAAESRVYQERLDGIVGSLEEHVDPFDLDVFSPYMQANLNKMLHRTSVLLGGLTSLDRMGLYSVTSRPPAGTQQEQHNVMLLSTCQSRFPLLPLSTQQTRFSATQPVVPQTLYWGGDTGGASLKETAAAVLPQSGSQKMGTSSSFYDKIGTGLGSMTDISNWFSTIGSK